MFSSYLVNPFYPLVTQRLILRPWKLEDVEALALLANDKRVSESLARVPHPYTLEDAKKFVHFSQETLAEGKALHLATLRQSDQTLLGGISYDEGLGYWIGYSFWGQGYGKEAARAFIRFLFFVCDQKNLYGSALVTNTASCRIFEGVGFIKTGGKDCTSLVYEGVQPGVTYALSKDQFMQHESHLQKPLVWAAAGIVLNEKGEILLTQRPPGKFMAGAWEPPGGKLEANETPEDALIREVKEEVGLEVERGDLDPLNFISYPYDSYHLVLTLYLCSEWKGTPYGAEGQKIAWVNFEELRELPLPPATVGLLHKIREVLKERGKLSDE